MFIARTAAWKSHHDQPICKTMYVPTAAWKPRENMLNIHNLSHENHMKNIEFNASKSRENVEESFKQTKPTSMVGNYSRA